ncbi:K88 minor fimbrial subunit faeI [Salmonella enterica subsp. enterica serovar Montevideo str. USDA-ARS-USMARC-1903]|nr:K88 minor fimbrial subunit faeI [Salmonella enterica subsp. enterica serovar Montevideo str. USDA-ARS-USMARC-1903]
MAQHTRRLHPEGECPGTDISLPRHRQCHRCHTRCRPRQCKTLGFLTVRHLRRKPLPAGRGGQDSFSQQDRHGRQGNRYYLLPTAQD